MTFAPKAKTVSSSPVVAVGGTEGGSATSPTVTVKGRAVEAVCPVSVSREMAVSVKLTTPAKLAGGS